MGGGQGNSNYCHNDMEVNCHGSTILTVKRRSHDDSKRNSSCGDSGNRGSLIINL